MTVKESWLCPSAKAKVVPTLAQDFSADFLFGHRGAVGILHFPQASLRVSILQGTWPKNGRVRISTQAFLRSRGLPQWGWVSGMGVHVDLGSRVASHF